LTSRSYVSGKNRLNLVRHRLKLGVAVWLGFAYFCRTFLCSCVPDTPRYKFTETALNGTDRYRLTHRAATDDMPWERETVSTGFQCHLLVLFCHVVVRQSYLRMYLCTLRVDSGGVCCECEQAPRILARISINCMKGWQGVEMMSENVVPT
jgi:hypothetical protein